MRTYVHHLWQFVKVISNPLLEVLDGGVAVRKIFESDDLDTAAFCSQSYRKQVAVINRFAFEDDVGRPHNLNSNVKGEQGVTIETRNNIVAALVHISSALK